MAASVPSTTPLSSLTTGQSVYHPYIPTIPPAATTQQQQQQQQDIYAQYNIPSNTANAAAAAYAHQMAAAAAAAAAAGVTGTGAPYTSASAPYSGLTIPDLYSGITMQATCTSCFDSTIVHSNRERIGRCISQDICLYGLVWRNVKESFLYNAAEQNSCIFYCCVSD